MAPKNAKPAKPYHNSRTFNVQPQRLHSTVPILKCMLARDLDVLSYCTYPLRSCRSEGQHSLLSCTLCGRTPHTVAAAAEIGRSNKTDVTSVLLRSCRTSSPDCRRPWLDQSETAWRECPAGGRYRILIMESTFSSPLVCKSLSRWEGRPTVCSLQIYRLPLFLPFSFLGGRASLLGHHL